ncbi:hypothetical protein SteCoe_19814 [Stentor coeruleus]|uniref:EF-hand domain-containing protein n=1 Tax=Stentor coeruleus TaxID=5963 RepID=A0A1R2BTM0_9CILI|nr:hypothetical protein SteCoe_19814 [Stentor coeruleus]
MAHLRKTSDVYSRDSVSPLYNKDLEVDISATSEDFNIHLNPHIAEKPQTVSSDYAKPQTPKIKFLKKTKIIERSKNLRNLKSIFQRTNICFENTIATVQCYRAELGITLQKIQASYIQLFDFILQSTDSLLTKKESKISAIVKKHENVIGEEIEARESIQEKLNKQNELISVLKTKLKISKTTEESLQYEIKQLRDIIKYDQNYTNSLRTNLEKTKHDEEDNENAQEKQSLKEDRRLKLNLQDLEKVISELEDDKKTNEVTLNEMHGVLVRMAKSNTSKTNWTQTEEGELFWNLDPWSIIPVPLNPTSYYCIVKEVEGLNINLTRPKPTDGVKWALTPYIMRFLATSPTRAALPYPYAHFKKLLMDICNERLTYNPDICGYMQPLMNLDEFICIYFLKKHQIRRIAELKIKEFLSSMKFYLKYQRVNIFSKVAGISIDVLENSEYIYHDYHTQMYFLFCIGILTSDPSALVESTEGNTWLKVAKVEDYTKQLMPWVTTREALRKVKKDLSYINKNTSNTQNSESESIDLDQLLAYYMKEYISLRQNNLEKLCKTFAKTDLSQKGMYNFEEFKFIISSTDDMALPDSVIARAFFYSITAIGNNSEINSQAFAASCMRFGIDNPCSLVQIGWDLIFPYPTIKSFIDGKDEKYSSLYKKDKVNTEKMSFLKVPSKIASPRQETQTSGISLEKVAALLAQHYSIIRELKKYAEMFRQLIMHKEDVASMTSAFEKLYNVLNSACDFFTFPIVF